jgi:hypothetical protein
MRRCAEVVDAHVRDVGLHAHPLPKSLEIDDQLTRDIAGEEEAAALRHGLPAQPDQRDRLMRDRNSVDPALRKVGAELLSFVHQATLSSRSCS